MEPEMQDFDVAGAKAAGYSDDEIASYLRQRAAAKTRTAPVRTDVGGPQPQTRPPAVEQRVRQEKARVVARQNVEDIRGLPVKILQAAAVPGQMVPGGEAAQAFARSLAAKQPYAEALRDIRGETAALPAGVRIPLKAVGAGVSSAVLPGSMAAQQAGYGALMGLTEASPEAGPIARAGMAATQAAGGYVAGKVLGNVETAARSFMTKTRPAMLKELEKRQAAEAGPLYEEFRELGTIPETEKLKSIMELPVIQQAVKTVKSESPQLSKLADTDAKVLDAVYKRIGQRSFKSQTGFETNDARLELLGAIDDATGGAYSPALKAFETGARRMESVQRGYRAGRPTAESMKSALTESPEALADWVKTATPEERDLVVKGLLSGLKERGMLGLRNPKEQIAEGMFTRGPSLSRATEVLRMLGQRPTMATKVSRGVAGTTTGRTLQDLFYGGQ